MLALAGLPGAGKSTLATALSRKLGWTVVSRDLVRLRLFPRARFDALEKDAANAAVCALALRELAARRSVIVDGMTFATAAQRRRVARLARQAGARPLFVHLDCPVTLAIARVDGREPHPAGDRTADLVRQVAQRFSRPRGALRLDARRSASALARRLLRQLRDSSRASRPRHP